MTPRRLLCGLPLLLVVPILQAPADAGQAPARGASAARSFTVTAAFTDSDVLLHERTVLKGKVRPVRDGKVLVQHRTEGEGWETVARRKLNDEGRYSYAFKPQEPGEHWYRARMPKVGAVRSGASAKQPLAVAEQALVVFRIPAGTGAGDWNTPETTVVARYGDLLRLVNGDSMSHQVHTDGAPFPHQSSSLAPGESEDIELIAPYDSTASGALYCHIHGPNSEFWVQVIA